MKASSGAQPLLAVGIMNPVLACTFECTVQVVVPGSASSRSGWMGSPQTLQGLVSLIILALLFLVVGLPNPL